MLGLRMKVTAAIALPILLVIVVLGFLLGREQIGLAGRVQERQELGTTLLLAQAVASAQAHGPAAVAQLLDATRAHPGLDYAVVVDGAGVEQAAYRAPDHARELEDTAPTDTPQVTSRGGLIHVRVPIPSSAGGESSKATLATGYSRSFVDGETSQSSRRLLIASLLLLVFGLAVALVVGGRVVTPLVGTSNELSDVSSGLVDAARAREASAAEQAAAVEETRRTMDMLLSSAQKIAESASVVLSNAERTLEGNREIADRIEQLNRHAEKVAEILASIMHVADRTDLLALNAALEGTKAGEAGKGFTLVAKEMRRLAENVMESVEGIRRLMGDVRSASQAAVAASQDGTEFSEETTRSVREIALVTQQQRKATEQVSRSMDEMTELLNHAMMDIKQTTRSAASLSKISRSLAELVTPGSGSKP